MRKPNEWTLPEAAEYEQVSLETVRRWVRNGELAVRTQRNPDTGRLMRLVRMDDVMQCARVMRQNTVATRNH